MSAAARRSRARRASPAAASPPGRGARPGRARARPRPCGPIRRSRTCARPSAVANGAMQLALHGPRVLLDLPAAVAGAGVLERQAISRHGVCALHLSRYAVSSVRQALLRAQARADQLPDWLRSRPARPSSSIPTATPSSTCKAARGRGRADRARHRDAHPRGLSCPAAANWRRARARRCICPTKATPTGSTASRGEPDVDADQARRSHHDRQRPDRRRAHAGPHARAPDVSRDRSRAARANRSPRRPATSSSSATSAGPICSSAPRTSRGRWRRARGRCTAACRRSRTRPDWLQIWPGHGAGSACGKGISAIPQSTLGYERRFNWAFQARSRRRVRARACSPASRSRRSTSPR